MKWQDRVCVLIFMVVAAMLLIQSYNVKTEIATLKKEKLALEIQTINLAQRIGKVEKDLEPMLMPTIGHEIIPIPGGGHK